MNIAPLLYTLLLYTTLKGMILYEAGAEPLELPVVPTFSTNEQFDFRDVAGLDAVADAIYNLVEVFRVVAIYVIDSLIFTGELIVYIGALIITIGGLVFTTIEGAPYYVNILVTTPQVLMMGIIIYKMLRSGETET